MIKFSILFIMIIFKITFSFSSMKEEFLILSYHIKSGSSVMHGLEQNPVEIINIQFQKRKETKNKMKAKNGISFVSKTKNSKFLKKQHELSAQISKMIAKMKSKMDVLYGK